jgi:ribosomal protein S8
MKLTLDLVNQFNFAILKRENFFICKKSKLNIALLNLLLNEGLILGFYQFKYVDKNLCVYIKYLDKKPLLNKVIFLFNKNLSLSYSKLKGDIQSNNLFIVSTNAGGLCLMSKKTIDNFYWFNHLGGKLLFKLVL